MIAHAASRASWNTLSPWIAVLRLFACIAAFFFAIWLYGAVHVRAWFIPSSTELTRETLVSALTAWAAIGFTGNLSEDSVRLWIDRFFSVVGFNLMVQYGFDYLFHIPPTPWPAVLAGSFFAIALIAAIPKGGALAAASSGDRILLLGYDAIAESIRPFLGAPISGAVGSPISTHAPVRYLGGFNRFDEVLAEEKPVRILINDPSWRAAISPRRMLALRYAGVTVDDVPSLFETFLKRVRWDHLDPVDLLFSPRLNINRSAIALQAVYTNLIGLSLLVLFSPVLFLAAAITVISTGASPLERVGCIGFQRIPFELVRFRTRRRSGKPAWSGSVLKALRLINLPQLLNVVRGEMALFGPPPVRREFAELLSRWIPVYAHRFTVKPGIMGWSQANLSSVLPGPDESLRLEYDLYYIREESPSFDLDILFRTIFRCPLNAPGLPE